MCLCVCVCAWEEKILSNACCDDVYKLGAAASWYQGLQYQINVFSRSRRSTRNLVENKLNINASGIIFHSQMIHKFSLSMVRECFV